MPEIPHSVVIEVHVARSPIDEPKRYSITVEPSQTKRKAYAGDSWNPTVRRLIGFGASRGIKGRRLWDARGRRRRFRLVEKAVEAGMNAILYDMFNEDQTGQLEADRGRSLID